MPFDEVLAKSKELDAIPFDIPNVEFTHYNNQSTFDYIVKKYKIDDNAILIMAGIIRVADTNQYYIAKESAGLWAISAGLSYNILDDYKLLRTGMVIYDALYNLSNALIQTNPPAK